MSTAEIRAGFAGLRADREGSLGGLLGSPLFLGAIVALFTWPLASIVPTVGPDPSWVAGLYMAHGEGLQFGQDVVFTYGPLGFLQLPVLYEPSLWVAAYLTQAVVHVTLAVALVAVAKRSFPALVAGVVAYLVLVVAQLDAALVLLAFICCLGALDRRRAVPPAWLAVAGGAVGSLELLVKINFGVAILAMVALTVLAGPRRVRSLGLFAASTALALLLAWVLSGQELAALPAFFSHGGEVVRGYSAAMGADVVSSGWQLPAALLAIAALLLATGAAAVRRASGAGWTCLALVLVFSFMTWKQGFVRQGIGTAPEFFALMLGAGIAVAALLSELRMRWAAIAMTASLAVLALAAAPSPSLLQAFQPRLHVESLQQGMEALVDPAEREARAEEGREWMRSLYAVDPAILERIGERGVHVDPWEAGVAWAYGLRWQPLPTLQSYVAYTPALDRLDAEALEAADGLETILRHRAGSFPGASGSVDDRFPGWESPAAMRAMLCNYRDAITVGGWQLLERAGERCGQPRLFATSSARTGTPIRVPVPRGPDQLVFARIDGIGLSGLESALSAAYRSPARTVEIAGRGSWSLVPATASDGLILRVPAAADFAPPFELAPNADRLTVWTDGPERDLVVRFFTQRIEPVGPVLNRSGAAADGRL